MKKLRNRSNQGVLLLVVELLAVTVFMAACTQEKNPTASTTPSPVQAASSGPTTVIGSAIQENGGAPISRGSSVQVVGIDLNGEYTGQVELDGVYIGTLFTPNATPTQMDDLGHIDLALNLTQIGNIVTGSVALDRTLVYKQVGSITATPIATPFPGTPSPTPQQVGLGPSVTGTFNGTTLELESESFEQNVAGQKVTRQFNLVATQVQKGGEVLVGTYRETIEGYSPQPSTVVGTFTINRPSFAPLPTELPTATP